MRMRSLAGRSVTVIGLGDVSFTRAAARNHEPADVVRRVHEALEHAIDVIDLAAEPDVEQAVGEAVRAVRARDRAVITTTVRLPDVRDARGVQAQVEASLRTTRLDGLPLVQLPLRTAWLASSAWPELHGTCDRLVREGKVLAWGAIVDPDDVIAEATPPAEPVELAGFATTGSGLLVPSAKAPASAPTPPLAHPLALPLFASLAIDFSLCARDAAPVLAVSTHAIFAHRPLAGGALAGRLGPGAVLARTDDRRGVDLDAIAIGVAKLARFVKHVPPAARSSEAARAIADTAPRVANIECDTLASSPCATRSIVAHSCCRGSRGAKICTKRSRRRQRGRCPQI